MWILCNCFRSWLLISPSSGKKDCYHQYWVFWQTFVVSWLLSVSLLQVYRSYRREWHQCPPLITSPFFHWLGSRETLLETRLFGGQICKILQNMGGTPGTWGIFLKQAWDQPWDSRCQALWRWRPLQEKSRPPGGTNHNRSQQITTDHNRSQQITTDHKSQQYQTLTRLTIYHNELGNAIRSHPIAKLLAKEWGNGRSWDMLTWIALLGSEVLITFLRGRPGPRCRKRSGLRCSSDSSITCKTNEFTWVKLSDVACLCGTLLNCVDLCCHCGNMMDYGGFLKWGYP